jgi:multiple sugar transport system permease protein
MAWKWMFDTSYSILNWTLVQLHLANPVDPPQYLAQPKLAIGSVIAVHAWRIIPFAVVIFLAGLASIPKEVDDAAAIDGATGFRKFWSVTLPLQLPIATVAVLFGIVFTATDMAVVYILTAGGPPPSFSTEMVTTWAYKTGIESGGLGAGAAISLFLLPVLAIVSILMLLFARRTEVS